MNTSLSDSDASAIEKILVDVLNVTADELQPEASIKDDLGADSLDDVEISLALEERFGLTNAEEQLERVKTVADLYETVAELLEQKRR